MKTKTFWVKLALVVLTLLFIWGNSLLPGELSGRESGFVLSLMRPVIDLLQRLFELFGVFPSPELLVRKLAHFSEYALLGLLTMALFVRPGLRMRILPPAGLCLMAAALDETIQIFSYARGPSVRDAALDCCGAVFGMALCALAFLIIRDIQYRKASLD